MSYEEKENIKTVRIGDEIYPASLKDMYDPPKKIFYKGEFSATDVKAVAIVGARQCSLYGTRIAEKFGYELAAKGITVVSGMAKGIDSAAHRGALNAGGRTIAVMGSGFKHIYPAGSKDLCHKISRQGAVITEFDHDIEPSKWTFPKRNRIVSGLSKGVVVIEAGVRSGALITVDFALQQGKEVFAVPGRIDMATSYGTNALIKTGANPVTDVEDILEILGYDEKEKKGSGDNVLEDEVLICDIIKKKSPVRIDLISELAKMDANIVSGILLRLEIKGKIKALPGKMYKNCKEK
ncbi:MAG: DNA-processing protein DprA [Candidatus Omnitrophota bacterium]